MTLYQTILSSLKWFISIGAKFIRVVPGYTGIIVLATLTSLFSLLLTLFFPLKVLILLGSSKLPSYFPVSWQAFDQHTLVLVAMIATVVFYLIHLLSEKAIAVFVERGANHLLKKSRKISLFKKQYKISKKSYGCYSLALATFCFLCTGLVLIAVIYPSLIALLLLYVICSIALLSIGCKFSRTLRVNLHENLSWIIRIISMIGFIIGFSFIVITFLNHPEKEITVAIASLILMRQLMSGSRKMITDLSKLFSQRHEINALFFHGKKLYAELSQDEKDAWSLTELPYRQVWIKNTLQKMLGISLHHIHSKWHQIGMSDVLSFEVTASINNQETPHDYFIKLFTFPNDGEAGHEETLLLDASAKQLPAPEFLGSTRIHEYFCHVFSWGKMHRLKEEGWRKKRLEILEELFFYRPSEHLIAQYKRSKLLLSERLEQNIIKHLGIIAHDPEQIDHLAQLEKELPLLCARLNTLPLQLINPEITLDTLVSTQEGKIKVTHWGKWTLDPLGSAWPIKRPKHLARLVKHMQLQYPALGIAKKDVILASLLFAFEAFYQEKRYDHALDLIPVIFACEET